MRRVYRPKTCFDCPCASPKLDLINVGGYEVEGVEGIEWCGYYERPIDANSEYQKRKPEWCKVSAIRFEKG